MFDIDEVKSPDQIFGFFVYIRDIIMHYPKLYIKILGQIESMALDKEDPSGLYDLPDYTKDLIRISKIDCDYLSNDNRSDHEEFIMRYK